MSDELLILGGIYCLAALALAAGFVIALSVSAVRDRRARMSARLDVAARQERRAVYELRPRSGQVVRLFDREAS